MVASDDAIHLGANLAMTVALISAILCAATILATFNQRMNYANLKAVYNKVNCYAPYENRILSGDKVQGFIDDFGGSIFIRVVTDAEHVGFYGSNILNARDVAHVCFVNPSKSFYCTMLRDKNNDIVGANFEQCNITITDSEWNAGIQYCNTLLGE